MAQRGTQTPLVVLSAGTTEVWRGIYRGLGRLVRKRQKRGGVTFALAYPDGDYLVLIKDGKSRRSRQPAGLVAIYANAALGITRGGVTITEFIAAQIPFVVVQEPDHWLSRRQQAQAHEAGLCHSCSLSRLKDPEGALEFIEKCLASGENERMKARMTAFPFNLEGQWGEYLLRSIRWD